MLLSLLILSLSWHHVLRLALADEITLTRHADGDVFTIPGSCHEACMVLSSDTASPYGSAPTGPMGNESCSCQCNYGLPVFREDLQICVDNIEECDVAGFVNGSGLVEKVPYVYLPQNGMIIYPGSEIKFKGVLSPVCVITGVQQLGRSGWTDLRNISDVEFPLSLFRDEQRTFLMWTGESRLRQTAEGKIVVVKLACRDSYPNAAVRGIFTPCVAFRVAGSPSRSSIKEVSFATSLSSTQGLSSAEYTAIGVSSALLALIYFVSVSLYLHSRKSRRRRRGDKSPEPERGQLPPSVSVDGEAPGLVKCNPLLAVSRHFESDTNSAVSEADLADKLLQSESETELENITAAIVHPHEDYAEQHEQSNNSSAIIAERLPEEDVRIVETTENGNQHGVSVFPGTQRRKLYFNPAYFEKQLLASPPPAAVDFLFKIREVISVAKHKMAAKRFIPTLNEIPEETSSDRQSVAAGQSRARRRASSVQNGALISPRKSLRCTGCPGCSHGSSTPNLPQNGGGALSGESRVRAWLEDVKLLDARWRSLEEERSNALRQQLASRGQRARDADAESARLSSKSLPPLFGELSPNGRVCRGCTNETFEGDEAPSRGLSSKRPARSVTREPGYFERQADEIAEWARRNHEENHVNANVRRAIEDSFKKQLEQLQSPAKKRDAPEKIAGVRSADKAIPRPPTAPPKVPTMPPKPPVVPTKTLAEKPKVVNQPSAEKAKSQETRVLLDVANGELPGRKSSDAKRIMDAVIQELVVAKDIDRVKEKETPTRGSDYETDSLEKSKVSRKSSSSPVDTEKSSPPLSTALPMDEELTMRNAMIDVQISETVSNKTNTIVKNHNLPEVVPLRPENYTLVSEVYVNDGYASPESSDDDSGPEIQYEPENPGHLTIKVADSPNNYIKQDESEYEPDTLDRKPMKLKINGDITYEKQDVINEVYVDSLERSSQIMLKSKRSFREGNDAKPPREYNSLREIYEARLKYQQEHQQQHQQQPPPPPLPENGAEGGGIRADSWRGKVPGNNCKCTSPIMSRYERRQRKADNQPDVVPNPPPPPPPPESESEQSAKNAKDRSLAEAGDPTTCAEAPVAEEPALVVGKPPAVTRKPPPSGSSLEKLNAQRKPKVADETVPEENPKPIECKDLDESELANLDNERRNEKRHEYRRFSKWRRSESRERRRSSRSRSRSKSRQEAQEQEPQSIAPTVINVEDSAYVSSPESNGSRRRLLLHDHHHREMCSSSTCTESDETSSGHGANSESGAESIETDSVFFGNFRARAERERLAAANCRRHSGEQQQRPINYQAFQIKSRVY